MKIAVLDDYQHAAEGFADWSSLDGCETTFFHEHIADPTHADAICDRLLHNAHRLALKGPSKRKEESSKK